MNGFNYSSTTSSLRRPLRRIVASISLGLALILGQGCGQATFSSPDKAVDALVAAAHAQDIEQLKRVLGPGSDEILSSGDQMADRNALAKFLNTYEEKHQIVPGENGAMTLVIGSSDWPMPIPVVQQGTQWRFDAQAGREEILNRRIGRNELSAIQTCHIVLDAQREYISRADIANGQRAYATRFISEAGKKNGLYWPVASNEKPSPLGPFAAAIAADGYKQGKPSGSSPRPYHGYRFRILTRQGAGAAGGEKDYMEGGRLSGGFAVVAWPAEYGNSGIMTFIMGHDGVIYQRDLGDDTAKSAESMAAYDPSPEWTKAEH